MPVFENHTTIPYHRLCVQQSDLNTLQFSVCLNTMNNKISFCSKLPFLLPLKANKV